MPYANSNRIITVASVSVDPATVHSVTIFASSAPATRDNGGDLLDGDRWVDTQSFIESVWYAKTWNFLTVPNFESSGIDGGGAEGTTGIIDLGGAVVDPLEVIYDGGDAVSN